MRLPLGKSTPSGGRTQGIRTDKLTTRLIEGAQDRQIRVRTLRPWPERAGLVSFDLLKPAEPAVAALKKKGIIVSEKDGYVRAGRALLQQRRRHRPHARGCDRVVNGAAPPQLRCVILAFPSPRAQKLRLRLPCRPP
jgi:transposase